MYSNLSQLKANVRSVHEKQNTHYKRAAESHEKSNSQVKVHK